MTDESTAPVVVATSSTSTSIGRRHCVRGGGRIAAEEEGVADGRYRSRLMTDDSTHVVLACSQ